MAKRTRRRKKTRGTGWKIFGAILLVMAVVCIVKSIGLRQVCTSERRSNMPDVPRNTYAMEGFRKENGRITYEDETRYTQTGIDVSVYQGDIDWNLVAQDGISYAIIQAGYRGYTDGELGEDVQYRTNLTGAVGAGLDIGIYFFSQAVSVEEAREEAYFLLELLAGVEPTLPVFYDWERADEGRTRDVSGEMVTDCAIAFCEVIEASGYQAGIYLNQDYIYNLVDLSRLKDYPLWFAQYQDLPDMIYDFTWWQYTDAGTVAGINHPVDLNIWIREK